MDVNVDHALVETFAQDVRWGLRAAPKQLQPKYFYDALGSSLFEAICRLPWYGITRAECALLERHGEEIVRAASNGTIVELGCGSGEKLERLAHAARRLGARPTFHLVDVSPQALAHTSERIVRLGFRVVAHEATFDQGLVRAMAQRKAGEPALVLFLGSNIGNFHEHEAAALLRLMGDQLTPSDALLLGTDLTKAERDLLLAYDDPLGVTAAFNRNLLVRINQELGGAFDIDTFFHRALWNRAAGRVEMHLVSTRRQDVRIAAADLVAGFDAGEHIWTESSYKYEPEQVLERLTAAGLAAPQQWIDEGARFALTLSMAAT